MKKFLISLLASLFLFTSYSFAFEYQDVPYGDPYFYAVDYLRRNDVFKDTKFFKPEIIISKAEFIKYLVLLNSPDFTSKINVKLPYEDTDDKDWYAPYFDEALKLGIISDMDKKIEPYKKLSVIDALKLLFHSQSIPIPKVYKGFIPYKDISRNKSIAPLIMRALEFDLIQAKSQDSVGIYRLVTRAEAAKMIYKMDLVNLTSPSKQDSSAELDSQLQKIINSWDLIFGNYVNKDKIDKTKLTGAAIKAMADSLDDPYSAYLDQSENAAFSDDLDGEIEGIGAFIAADDKGNVTIVSPIVGSPAEKAGILPGDVIFKVDDQEVAGMNLYEVVNMIKGPKGTTVKITVKRDGLIKEIDVIRDVVKIDALKYETVDGGKVMLIKLYQFSQTAPEEFQSVVEIMQNNPNIKGLIIDVRDNPGGLLDAVDKIMNFLLKPESAVVNIEYNFFSYTQFSSGKGELAGFPMVVLINKGSASASEILAGALKDYDAATLIGETSFGKGSVQEVNYFIDNSSLKLTVAKWLTPLRNTIDKTGITPDIQVTDLPDTSQDEQMDRALTEINKLINK